MDNVIKFEKSQYPISSDGMYQVVALTNEGEVLDCALYSDGRCVTVKANEFHLTNVDLSNAVEVPGLRRELDEIADHNAKMQAWRDAE